MKHKYILIVVLIACATWARAIENTSVQQQVLSHSPYTEMVASSNSYAIQPLRLTSTSKGLYTPDIQLGTKQTFMVPIGTETVTETSAMRLVSSYNIGVWKGSVSEVGAETPNTAPVKRSLSGGPTIKPAEPFLDPVGDIPWVLMLLLAFAYGGRRVVRRLRS